MVGLDLYLLKFLICLKTFEDFFCKVCGFGSLSSFYHEAVSGAGSQSHEAIELLQQLFMALLYFCH